MQIRDRSTFYCMMYERMTECMIFTKPTFWIQYTFELALMPHVVYLTLGI